MTKRLGVQIILLTAFLIIGAWTGIALTPMWDTGGIWAQKVSLYYDLEIDLLYVRFGMGAIFKMVNGVIKHNAGNYKSSNGHGWMEWAVKLNEEMSAKQTIEDFRMRVCAISSSMSVIPGVGQMCYVWGCLKMASWTMLGCIILGCILELAGCCVLINWAFYKPRTKDRKLCTLLLSLPPVIFSIGTTYFCYKLSDLQEMYPVTDGMLLGPMAAFAAALCALSALPPLACCVLLGETGSELYNEQLREQKMFAREWQEEQKAMEGLEGYGATQQPPGGYGYAQPSQPYAGMPQQYGGVPQPYGAMPQPYVGVPQPYGGMPQAHGGMPQAGPM